MMACGVLGALGVAILLEGSFWFFLIVLGSGLIPGCIFLAISHILADEDEILQAIHSSRREIIREINPKQ